MMRACQLMLAATAALILQQHACAKERRSVLDVARSYKDGGGYVWEAGSGAPRTINFEGETLLAAQEKGTYCSGFTFSVAMQAAVERGLLKGKKLDDVRRFQKEWYGVPKEAQETQCALAVERLGIGRRVKDLEEARPGDFVQIWRTNKSGHSVVLVEPVREDGKLVGLRYRSSQKATDGIGERVEYFADVAGHDGKVDRARTYVARLDDSPGGLQAPSR
jgi:hypothetical protein